MNKMKNYNLAFFMTEGVSLGTWNKVGMLLREIEPYNILASYLNEIYIFTYGDKSELKYQKYFKSNIKIIYKETALPSFVYSFLLPIINWHIIEKCHFLKTNQMRGSQAAVIANIFSRRSNLIARTGYTWSIFAKDKNKIIQFLVKFLEKIVYNQAKFAFVTSKEDKQYLIKKYKTKDQKIKVISNYINTDQFKPQHDIIKNNKLIYIGRLNKQKNLFNLMKSLKNIGLTLDIIGSGELKEDLEKLAVELKVQVNFLGNLPNKELPNILNQYGIFILPSLYEGMPKTLLEAMSCGLACIGANVSGIKEVIKHNETGILCGNSVSDLRKAILDLINNTNKQKQLGENAREFILNNFSLNTQIKKEIDIYLQIINETNKTNN